ncbi:flagellar hook-associated protein FlgK [Allorhizobium terrae]|uniref:Flagellar hook-associated protein 1 n=1 Tax=Allorhizobium terrae TaxID=1848972 RepID=A0A4S3ZY29_9HYPH|nr:flagellar hook-associated protein FlgK [Allorhizobium terrae]THF50843.1 flagellar hook-associated protein FlgK [Allorhizobium terrae]TWD55411.1 flagellar hook-associated protein 1 FlgK [Agrobacterium vitis]
MTLSTTMNTANGILGNSSTQSQVVSKNISNSQTVGYVKRDAVTVVNATGGSTVKIIRAEDVVLQKQMLTGQSTAEGQATLNKGLDQLKALLGGNDYDLAPSTYISKLQTALQSYAAQPSETTLAQTAVSTAQDLANSITATSQGIAKIRVQADTDIKGGVDSLNDLLSQFMTVNEAVIKAKAAGEDPNDALDRRDKLVSDISKLVGVSKTERPNGDMALYTNEGTVLFDKIPRSITFDPRGSYGAGIAGNSVYIDGVPLKAGVGGNTSAQGSLAANLQIRDTIAPQFEQQLDETSRSLISMFSEKEKATGNNPMPGLFTWQNGTTPPAGALQPGISATFAVNPAYVKEQGGDPVRLRDGGVNGALYKWNTDNTASYSTLLNGYVAAFDTKVGFDATVGLESSATVGKYAASSVGWLEAYRSTADSANETKAALSQRATEAYQNKTGVSLDEELSKMLDIEQSYKASAKLISTVDEMLKSLLGIA